MFSTNPDEDPDAAGEEETPFRRRCSSIAPKGNFFWGGGEYRKSLLLGVR